MRAGGVVASGLWTGDSAARAWHMFTPTCKMTREQGHKSTRGEGKRKALRLERVAGGGGAWAAAVCRHPHEALENCECYKLPNCGRDWNEALSLLQADWT